MKTKVIAAAMLLAATVTAGAVLVPVDPSGGDWLETVSADEQVTTGSWLDYAATAYAGGSGTVEDPYQIANAEQLAKLSLESFQGKYQIADEYVCFKLIDDIDLSGHYWYPIGCQHGHNEWFCGYLDGNGKTISGLTVDITDNQYCTYAGLFGSIKGNAGAGIVGVENLIINDAKITGKVSNDENLLSNSGILVGDITSMGAEVIVKNVTVSGSVSTDSNFSYGEFGGLIGYAYDITISDCTVEQVSISNTNVAGGLIGLALEVQVSDCTVKNVTTSNINSFAGGFLGQDWGISKYENCSASGSINGNWNCGGFVGIVDTDGTSTVYQNCIAKVDVTVSNTYDNAWGAGGFAGYTIDGHFDHCIAYGNVSGNTHVGGFVGYAYASGKYANCASYGNVSSSADSNPYVGGFVGTLNGAEITNCHSLGTVSSPVDDTTKGGFVGSCISGDIQNTCTFAQDKNPTLSGAGEAVGVSSSEVLANICVDVLNGHQYVNGVCSVCGAKDPNYIEPSVPEEDVEEPEEEEESTPVIDTTPPDFILNAGGIEEALVSDEDSGIVDENGSMTVTIGHKTLSSLVIYRRDGYLVRGWTAEVYIPREVLKELYVNHTSCDIVLEFTPAENPEGTSRPAYQINIYCLKNGVKTPIELKKGSVTVTFPYTIAPGENPAALAAVTIDEDGKTVFVEGSGYRDGDMVFEIRKSGVYGVGYSE